MLNRIIMVALSALFFNTAVLADDSFFEEVLGFTKCSGFWYATSDLLKKAGGDEDEVILYHNMGNGAHFSATVLTMVESSQTYDELSPKIEAMAETYHDQYMVMFQQDKPVFRAEAKQCLTLVPLQQSIIDEMRKETLK